MTYDTFGLGRYFFLALCLCHSFLSFSQEIPSDTAVIMAGEALFKANCRSCHKVKKNLIGPALAGIQDRAPSIDWINSFVRNSSKVIASGDEYANKIYEENGKVLMTAFTSFSDEQVMSILAYVKAEEEKQDEIPVTSVTANSTDNALPFSTTYLYAILVGLLIVLLLLAVVLGMVVSALKKYLLQQQNIGDVEKEVIHSPYSLRTFAKSPAFIFIVVFVLVAVSFKTIIDGLYSIGIQQNYAPIQPIAFSHKVHAGEYEIECKYCHTGAMKGRSANIPSPDMCMNCHTQIRKGTNTGESEIAKILTAVETDKPIEWVRVHNLPDLAYFNHSQHVNVGGIECQTCHGAIEEMDVVKQHSSLTMGWCVDCHRKTDLKTKGNKYYDNLLELHKSKMMKVEDVGGLECAKCHY